VGNSSLFTKHRLLGGFAPPARSLRSPRGASASHLSHRHPPSNSAPSRAFRRAHSARRYHAHLAPPMPPERPYCRTSLSFQKPRSSAFTETSSLFGQTAWTGGNTPISSTAPKSRPHSCRSFRRRRIYTVCSYCNSEYTGASQRSSRDNTRKIC
jgi:hypothetical protein